MKEIVRELLLKRINEDYKILSQTKEWKRCNEKVQENKKILLEKLSDEDKEILQELVENFFAICSMELIFAYKLGASDALDFKEDLRYKEEIEEYLNEV